MIARDAEQKVFAAAAASTFGSTTAHNSVKRTGRKEVESRGKKGQKAEEIEGDAEPDREQSEQQRWS